MTEEQFASLVVRIWRLRIRRAIHKANGNARAAKHCSTRLQNLAAQLVK